MVLRKSFLSFALCAVVGFGAAYLIVLIAVPISLLLGLVVSGLLIVLLAGLGFHYRKRAVRSSALWGACVGYIAFLAAMMWIVTRIPTIPF